MRTKRSLLYIIPCIVTASLLLTEWEGEGCHLYALDDCTGSTRWCIDAVDQYAVASFALPDEEEHIYLPVTRPCMPLTIPAACCGKPRSPASRYRCNFVRKKTMHK